ncbi:sensor histidine kinase [Phenylobacterium soli]|uniref:histidine kinase n=1 Tax=Phenylobacterium soli TaxID=2170551 RepID=A0A328AR26_9CAUL|nr:histidine kinase dimerization/phosphoacceptor domain -containing protein [Phenylobacterium soli]RAK55964.1 histidine kinase [Phenylobacterium soli]
MAARTILDPDTGLALALAVVGSSTSPLVLLDGDFNIVAASVSFFDAFQLARGDAEGRSLFDLSSGEWNVPQLRALLKATAAGDARVEAYEMDLTGDRVEPRHLVVNARKLDYGDPEHVRLLLSVTDVTDARLADKLKDDLLREKAILLQEIQHRVANSLQIIASVILQSARHAQSEEARSYLRDAHSRVMSVATLQQQLAASRLGDVDLRPYFTQLCESIGASMIRDRDRLTLEVNADASPVPAQTSVSLGLIVTELVINSLKHAFPGDRRGRIVVEYHAHGPNWELAVTDNGIGMPKDAASASPGLGTGIIAALATQLRARVQVTDAHPGTTVSLIHGQWASVQAERREVLGEARS